MQMIHVGLIEIAYDDFSKLRVTDEGKKVLFEGKKVSLVMPQPKEKAKEKAPRSVDKSKTQVLRDELFDRLVAMRKQVAQKQGVPPYLIFSDATLQIMAERRPLTDGDMLQVSGVGERKLQLYGDAFMDEIRRFVREKSGEGQTVTGSTQLQSWEMFKSGETVEAIAKARELSPFTVVSHLATMYERGELLDIRQWVSPEESDLIQGALPLFEEPYSMKALFDHFNGKFTYDKIRWAMAERKRLQR
jgi:ATP-dependent DNA helicase RecQ